MNDELKDKRIRGKKMLTGKRLIFAILGAVLVGAVIAGVYYYETAYKYRQYSIDLNSDLGKLATKIALDTAVSEGYKQDELIPRYIKAQIIGFDYQGTQNPVYDIKRLWVLLSENDVYKNSTLITNHPIKDGERSILQFDFVWGNEKIPWKPSGAQWPATYLTITKQNSIIDASLEGGVKRARIINPAIMEMSAEESKKQIDLINEAIYRNGGTNLTYETNILILYKQYSTNDPQYYSKSIEVIIDFIGNNATVSGIIRRESGTEPKDGYQINRDIEESILYHEPKTIPIKLEN